MTWGQGSVYTSSGAPSHSLPSIIGDGFIFLFRRRGFDVNSPSQAADVSCATGLFKKIMIPSSLLFDSHKTQDAPVNLNFR